MITVLWIIIGSMVAFCALLIWQAVLLIAEQRQRRRHQCKFCGCHELKGKMYDYGRNSLCDDKPAKEGRADA